MKATARDYGARVTSIHPHEFNHGLTRNLGIEMSSGEIIVLLSQDAIPGDEYLVRNFVEAFDDPQVAGAYARQVPREDADVLTQRNIHTWLTGRRTGEVRWINDRTTYQTMSPTERYFFCNFVNEFGEDIDWAQNILEAGWKIAYQPKAFVIHSHHRSVKYEYTRNLVCHKKLYEQFSLCAVPTWKHVFISTIHSMKLDWRYALRNGKRKDTLVQLLIRIPAISFASVYGQYRGAKAAKDQLKVKVSRI
jgi:rhamnosyltransferase